jgi:protein O-mannosyl-transferase
LTADTDLRPFTSVFDGRVFIGLLFIIAMVWIASRASQRESARPIAFGILWFFLALIPSSSIVPLSEVMNDHRMYFPFVGAVLSAVWAVGLALSGLQTTRLQPAVIVAAIALLSTHAAGTWQRNVVWRSEESLWRDVIEKSPRNGRGLMTFGVIQMSKGNLPMAEEYFNRALEHVPQYSYLHVNLAVLKAAQGKPVDAERHFREAQQYDAGNPVSYYYYANWLASIGRMEEAETLARRAVELSPAHVEARQLLDSLDGTRPATAEQWLERSLRQYQAGAFASSIASSGEALKLRPDYAEAFNNICAAENALGRYAAGIAACERALALKPDFPRARNNLAYARSKRSQ